MTDRKVVKKRIALRNRQLAIVTSVLLAIAIVLAIYLHETRNQVVTNDAYVAGNIITLKAQTAGIVVDIAAESTQQVSSGDVLIRLDGQHASIAVEQAKAALADTVRRVAMLYADSEILRKRIVTQKTVLTRIHHDIRRYRGAISEGAVTAQQLQNAEDQAREVSAQLSQAQAELSRAETAASGTEVSLHPLVRKAATQFKQVYLDYVRRDILSPVSGYIGKRHVQIGDWVKPGTPLITVVPLDDLWVDANFLETDLARIRPGQQALITVDADSNTTPYHGTVEGLLPATGSLFSLLPPENATGNYIHIVERVPIRIGLDRHDVSLHPLRPGLSAFVTVKLDPTDKSPLLSLTTIQNKPSYHTDLHTRELASVEGLIGQIIEENLPKTTGSKEDH